MATPSSDRIIGVNEFFAASEARVDRWRTLNRVAKALAAGGARPAGGHGPDPKALLAELAAAGGPLRLSRARSDGAGPRAPEGRRLDRLRASRAADQRRASRQQLPRRPGALEGRGRGRCPPARRPAARRSAAARAAGRTSRSCSSRPPSGPCGPEIRETFRRLRRVEDEFVYEPVVVGSFEDAVLAVVFNSEPPGGRDQRRLRLPLAVHDARAARDPRAARCRSPSPRGTAISAPSWRGWCAGGGRSSTSISRPTATSRSWPAPPRRRRSGAIFYGVEEPMEIHLAILDGVKDRYETPYFDNLKQYAQRPIGTFHALPIARGKSIFKSNWIRDMGEFYGANLFLAESSATTGGLDSLLEPTGNIKVAQDKAARAFGGDRSFFVTNGTSTSNKIVHQALLQPGRHRPDRPRLPQVAPLRARAGGRAAALHRRLPAHAVLDVRQPRHQADQEGAAAAQGRGQARPREAWWC